MVLLGELFQVRFGAYAVLTFPAISGRHHTFFVGNANKLDRFVQGDIVWMKVESRGSLSYDTQIGGSTTVPIFWVDNIKRVKGSC